MSEVPLYTPNPTASEQGGRTIIGFEDFYLKAEALTVLCVPHVFDSGAPLAAGWRKRPLLNSQPETRDPFSRERHLLLPPRPGAMHAPPPWLFLPRTYMGTSLIGKRPPP